MSENAPILALVRDLIFSTKIATTARSAGIDIQLIRDPSKLPQQSQAGQILLVDLNLPGAIEAAAQWRQATSGSVVGFVSHVDAETASAARDAGIDRVLARSRFVEILPQLLSRGTIP